jgi:hypothetical protein
LLRKQADEVAAGPDRIGVSFDTVAAPIVFEAGNRVDD